MVEKRTETTPWWWPRTLVLFRRRRKKTKYELIRAQEMDDPGIR